MDRTITNFPSHITAKLTKLLQSDKYKDSLKYYQILTAEYFKLNISKGLFLYHHMGFGKTVGSYHIMFEMLNKNPDMKALVIAPRALLTNFKQSAKKYEQFTKNSLKMDKINFVKFSHTTEKQISVLDPDNQIDPFQFDAKARNANKLKNLNGYIIFIEEAHMFARRISHGSEAMIQLYELIMRSDCRVVMLSGSLIASSPFELVPIMNILSGETLLPETEDEFNDLFLNFADNKIKNRFAFQNRLFGLVSRMKPEYLGEIDKSKYPEALETLVVKIPMGEEQLQGYIIARTEEIKQEKEKKISQRKSRNTSKFKSSGSVSGSFRVRSRQLSNAVTSREIELLYKSKEYDQNLLIEKVFESDLAILETEKAKKLVEYLESRKNQKVLVYTQFVGVGGAASIAAYLHKIGYQEVDANLQSSNYYKDTSKKGTFARINGSLTEEEQARLVDYYCDKSNDHAEKLQLLIIGFEQTMGLDLTSVRLSIMYEPYWVDFIRDQFKHRSVRLGAHLSLPEKERNTQMVIFLSTYPKSVNLNKLEPEAQQTTDEYIYEKMVNNGILTNSFKEAIEEVSIECELVKTMGDSKHQCRMCPPTSRDLYTKSKGNPMKSIINDIDSADPCSYAESDEVEAKKIEITIDGKTLEYYYVKSDDNIYGITVYMEISPGMFEEVPTSSFVFKKILEKLNL